MSSDTQPLGLFLWLFNKLIPYGKESWPEDGGVCLCGTALHFLLEYRHSVSFYISSSFLIRVGNADTGNQILLPLFHIDDSLSSGEILSQPLAS